jgi:DNA-binding NtrC family response regulator
LIQGPSGTGKELVANYLHANSPRREEAFVALNCSSLPENLIESELFGHEKGAFTSASSRKEGLVQLADGGTLFLDEIAELAMILQPKLLRFLQTGEYRRIGGNGSLRSDVRVIAATNADLRDAVAEKRFREDLLFRLNVITLQLPSLKERKDDIPLLVDHFLAGLAGIKTPKRIEPEVLDVMMKYEWPGNVRELENVIRRAALLAPEETISPDLLALPAGPAGISRRQQGISPANKLSQRALTLNELQRAYVIEVLDSVGWDVKLAAKILGMRAQTLYARMRAYHLKKPT